MLSKAECYRGPCNCHASSGSSCAAESPLQVYSGLRRLPGRRRRLKSVLVFGLKIYLAAAAIAVCMFCLNIWILGDQVMVYTNIIGERVYELALILVPAVLFGVAQVALAVIELVYALLGPFPRGGVSP